MAFLQLPGTDGPQPPAHSAQLPAAKPGWAACPHPPFSYHIVIVLPTSDQLLPCLHPPSSLQTHPPACLLARTDGRAHMSQSLTTTPRRPFPLRFFRLPTVLTRRHRSPSAGVIRPPVHTRCALCASHARVSAGQRQRAKHQRVPERSAAPHHARWGRWRWTGGCTGRGVVCTYHACASRTGGAGETLLPWIGAARRPRCKVARQPGSAAP